MSISDDSKKTQNKKIYEFIHIDEVVEDVRKAFVNEIKIIDSQQKNEELSKILFQLREYRYLYLTKSTFLELKDYAEKANVLFPFHECDCDDDFFYEDLSEEDVQKSGITYLEIVDEPNKPVALYINFLYQMEQQMARLSERKSEEYKKDQSRYKRQVAPNSKVIISESRRGTKKVDMGKFFSPNRHGHKARARISRRTTTLNRNKFYGFLMFTWRDVEKDINETLSDIAKMRLLAKKMVFHFVLIVKRVIKYILNRDVLKFHFSSKEFIYLYTFNPNFRYLIDSGKYWFVDGYVVLASKQNFKIANGKLKVKEEVKADIKKYCVRFEKFGISNRDDLFFDYIIFPFIFPFYLRYHLKRELPFDFHRYRFKGANLELSVFDNADNVSSDDLIDLDSFFTNHCNKFSDALRAIMNAKGVTEKQLSQKALISERTVQRMRNPNEQPPALELVVAVCVALDLVYFVGEKMCNLAGHCLINNKKCNAYRVILLNAMNKKYTVRDANSFLEQNELKRLV